MKRALPLLFVLLLSAASFAQTTQNLPSTLAAFTNYGTYQNYFADDIPATVGGQAFYVSINGHTDSTGACISSCNIQFWNLETNVQTNVPYTGSIAGQTVTGTFSQAPYVGSFVLVFVQKTSTPPCGRYGCKKYYVQQGSTLTLN